MSISSIVPPKGVVDIRAANPVAGYSVIRADNMGAALEIALR